MATTIGFIESEEGESTLNKSANSSLYGLLGFNSRKPVSFFGSPKLTPVGGVRVNVLLNVGLQVIPKLVTLSSNGLYGSKTHDISMALQLGIQISPSVAAPPGNSIHRPSGSVTAITTAVSKSAPLQ